MTMTSKEEELTGTRFLSTDAGHRGVEQRLLGHAGRQPVSEVLHVHAGAGHGRGGGKPGVGDRRADAVPVRGAGDVAERDSVYVDRLLAEDDGLGIVENEAREFPGGLLGAEERVAADEVALVEPDGEPEPRLVRIVLGGHVRAPRPVALLQTQAVER